MSDIKKSHIAGLYAIIVALIGFCGTLIGILLAHNLNEKKSNVSIEKISNPIEKDSVIEVLRDSINKLHQQTLNNLYKYEFITDKDRIQYRVIRLVGKIWLADDLKTYVHNSFCYEDNPQICRKYGRLYTWQAAQEACLALGSRWRLPTKEEWDELVNQYGGFEGDKKAYTALSENGSLGFDAQLGGCRSSGGRYTFLGQSGFYWSNTRTRADDVLDPWAAYAILYWSYSFNLNYQHVVREEKYPMEALACRCIKDDPPH